MSPLRRHTHRLPVVQPETFSRTVFEVDFPLLGVTVTVTRQEPLFSPFTEVPDTLHTRAEVPATRSLTFEPDTTFKPANLAIAVAVTPFLVVKASDFGVEVVVVDWTFGATDDVRIALMTGDE